MTDDRNFFRVYDDQGICQSVCARCFVIVATSPVTDELLHPESRHVCAFAAKPTSQPA